MINFLSKKTGLNRSTIKTLLIVFSLIIVVLVIFFKQYLDRVEANRVVTPPVVVSFDPIVPFPDPAPGEVEFGGTKIAISLFMGAEVDLSTLEIETSPHIELTPIILQDNPERVVLTPRAEWQSGTTYTITIKKGLLSEVTGREMKEDLILEYKIKDAELIPPSEEISPFL